MDVEKHLLKIPREATFPTLTPPESYDVYAHAYWLAAEQLFRTYWADVRTVPIPDYVVMPTLYLLHHFVELELKEVIRASYCLNGGAEVKDVSGGHSLTSLLRIALENLDSVFPRGESLFDTESCEFLGDLENFSRLGEGLRYPETLPKKGQTNEPTFSGNYIADIPAVMKRMYEVKGRLWGCIGYLHNCLQELRARQLDEMET